MNNRKKTAILPEASLSRSFDHASSNFDQKLPVGLVIKQPARKLNLLWKAVVLVVVVGVVGCFISSPPWQHASSRARDFSNGYRAGTLQVLNGCNLRYVAQLAGFPRYAAVQNRPRALALSLSLQRQCVAFGVGDDSSNADATQIARQALQRCAENELSMLGGQPLECSSSFDVAQKRSAEAFMLDVSASSSASSLSCCVIALLEMDHPHRLCRPTLTYPGLRAPGPVWPAAQFDEVRILEQHFDVILGEFHAIRDQLKFKLHPEKLVAKGSGAWEVFTLMSGGLVHDDNAALAPRTTALVQQMERTHRMHFGLVYFSNLLPGTHIKEHTGLTNLRIRIHLGLEPGDGAYMSIAGQKLVWQQGRCLVIDDSFPHFVVNEGTLGRAILIVDIWHPDLASDEINAIVEKSEPIVRIEKDRPTNKQ